MMPGALESGAETSGLASMGSGGTTALTGPATEIANSSFSDRSRPPRRRMRATTKARRPSREDGGDAEGGARARRLHGRAGDDRRDGGSDAVDQQQPGRDLHVTRGLRIVEGVCRRDGIARHRRRTEEERQREEPAETDRLAIRDGEESAGHGRNEAEPAEDQPSVEPVRQAPDRHLHRRAPARRLAPVKTGMAVPSMPRESA